MVSARNSIRVTKSNAEIMLQDLLDYTCLRLYKCSEEFKDACTGEENNSLKLILEWGCGKFQQPLFKQNFDNNTNADTNNF